MKRLVTILVFALITGSAAYSQSFYGSQYFVGTAVNDSITSTPISDPGPGGCYPSPTHTVTFPVSKVTGIENYMLITAVSLNNSAYTTQVGKVHVGDTLPFTSKYPSYDFYFPTGGGIVYTIKATGTPKVAGESYSCGQFVETTNATDCPDVVSYTFIQTAKVQVTTGIVSPLAFKIIPLVNLASPSLSNTTTVSIDASVNLKDTKFELYDASGRKAASQMVNDHTFTVDCKGIPEGSYFWKVINNSATIGLGKVVITH